MQSLNLPNALGFGFRVEGLGLHPQGESVPVGHPCTTGWHLRGILLGPPPPFAFAWVVGVRVQSLGEFKG